MKKKTMSEVIGLWIKAQHLENGGRHGVAIGFDEKRGQFLCILDCALRDEGRGYGDTPAEALQAAVTDHSRIIREAKEVLGSAAHNHETDHTLN